MPATHSVFLASAQSPTIAGLYAPPIRKAASYKYQADPDRAAGDVVEEALDLFRPNSFSKSFEIKGPADRTLVYLLLYIGDCLGRLTPDMPLATAQQTLARMNTFALPGEAGFPLNGMFPAARGGEADALRSYLAELRAETRERLLGRVYAREANAPSKWWMAFQKRKFMNKSL